MQARLTSLLAATIVLVMAGTAGAKTQFPARCGAGNLNNNDAHHQADQGQHKDRGEHNGLERGGGHDRGDNDEQGDDEGHHGRGHHAGGIGDDKVGSGGGGSASSAGGGGSSVGVPEPATLALMGLGLVGCAIRSRRRTR